MGPDHGAGAAASGALRLTSLAATAGCAAKIAQVDLIAALRHVPPTEDPRVIVGLQTGDDAAVIAWPAASPGLALVQTVDVFTPIVDDPFDYGRIAAANALSDVYAMGGTPLSALSFVAWPMDSAGPEALGAVLRGAASICAQAGIAITGGHSIVDREPKFGLFVTGTVDPARMLRNDAAQPGDLLVLTKPIGTGILTTAHKRGAIGEAGLAPAIAAMTTLNADAAEAAVAAGVRAATDVTGFGLLGHLGNVLRASSTAGGRALGATLWAGAVPLLPQVAALAAAGLCPGGSRRNLAFAAPRCQPGVGVDETTLLILADAQTSGGLLLCVAPAIWPQLEAALTRAGTLARAVIGQVGAAAEAGAIAIEAAASAPSA